MDNESRIVELLTEIRDNQKRQLEAHQESRREYLDFYTAALAKQQRRALIAAVVVAVGMGLLVYGLSG